MGLRAEEQTSVVSLRTEYIWLRVRYGTVWYGTVRYGTVQYGTVQWPAHVHMSLYLQVP